VEIEGNLSVCHEHMVPRKAVVRNNPFSVNFIARRVFKKDTSQNMARSKSEKDAVWLIPAPFGDVF
jgi:hypothetical protein